MTEGLIPTTIFNKLDNYFSEINTFILKQIRNISPSYTVQSNVWPQLQML